MAGRPKKILENTGLMPWPEVAKRMGLSTRHVHRIARRALAKLHKEFQDAGLDEEYLVKLAHDREREEQEQHDALADLAAVRYLDE